MIFFVPGTHRQKSYHLLYINAMVDSPDQAGHNERKLLHRNLDDDLIHSHGDAGSTAGLMRVLRGQHHIVTGL